MITTSPFAPQLSQAAAVTQSLGVSQAETGGRWQLVRPLAAPKPMTQLGKLARRTTFSFHLELAETATDDGHSAGCSPLALELAKKGRGADQDKPID